MISPHTGKTTAQMMLANSLVKPVQAGINYDVVPHDNQQAQRAWSIQSWWQRHNFMGNDLTRVALPYDSSHSQQARINEWWKQSAMPWGNHFMVTETDKQRENSIGLAYQNKQKQLADSSTYGQFYAFMHALSAAFGTIRSG